MSTRDRYRARCLEQMRKHFNAALDFYWHPEIRACELRLAWLCRANARRGL